MRVRPVELEDFLGDWRDSMGHRVRVDWSRPGSRGGQLDVLLIKPHSGRDPIRLNVKAMGRGQFACGHYDLEVDKSHSEKIVWGDRRNRAKFSEWVREEAVNRGRSRSRSRSRRRNRSRSRRRHRSRSRSRRHRDRSRSRDERDASPPQGFPNLDLLTPSNLPHSGIASGTAGGGWPGPSFPGPPPCPALPPPGPPPALPPPGPWHGAPGGQGGPCWSPWGSPVLPSYGWLGAPPGPPPAIAAGTGTGAGEVGRGGVDAGRSTSTGRAAGDGHDLYADLHGNEPAQLQPAVRSRSFWSVVSTPGAWAPPNPNKPVLPEPPPKPDRSAATAERGPGSSDARASPGRGSARALGHDAPAAARSRGHDLQAERAVPKSAPPLKPAGDALEGSEWLAAAGSPNTLEEAAKAAALELKEEIAEVALPELDRLLVSQRDTTPEAVIILNPDGLDQSQVSHQLDGPGLEDIVEPSAPNLPQDAQHCSPAAPAEPAQGALAPCSAGSAVEVVLSVGAGHGAQSEAADPRDPRRRRQIPSPQPAPEPEAQTAQAEPSLPAESAPKAEMSKGSEVDKEMLLLAYDALLLGGDAAA